MQKETLRMERVCCADQGIAQLEGFGLRILEGEIMGLLPINSHGLTSLLRLLQRNTPLRYGYVYYREELINSWRSPRQRNNRIGLIQSESCLVGGLTVSDNIFVLRPDFKQRVMRPSVFRKQLAPFLKSVGINISADAYVDELTDFERVVVDILKSVTAGCRLIVLTDISANMCEAELLKIHVLLRRYAGEGISFLYIDYNFEELRRVCAKVALMSNGRIAKLLRANELTQESLGKYTRAYNEKIRRQVSLPAYDKYSPGSLFEIKGLSGELIDNLNFSVSSGECVALQNVDEQVFGELLSIIGGGAAPKKGEILIDGKPAALRAGGDISVISDLPTKTMLFNELSYFDNLCFLLDGRLPEIWRDGRLRAGVRREYSAILGEGVFDARIDTLSETQKYYLVYTRIAIRKPKVVFCVQPFRRADMELRVHITGLMRMLLDKGAALVVLAVGLADSLPLADRLIRIRKGLPEEVCGRGEFATMP